MRFRDASIPLTDNIPFFIHNGYFIDSMKIETDFFSIHPKAINFLEKLIVPSGFRPLRIKLTTGGNFTCSFCKLVRNAPEYSLTIYHCVRSKRTRIAARFRPDKLIPRYISGKPSLSVRRAVRALNKELEEIGIYCTWKKALTSRIEVAVDLRMNHASSPYLAFALKCNLKRMKTTTKFTKKDGTVINTDYGVYFVNNSHQLVMYDKMLDLVRKRCCLPKDCINLLRLEYRITSSTVLKRLIGGVTVDCVTANLEKLIEKTYRMECEGLFNISEKELSQYKAEEIVEGSGIYIPIKMAKGNLTTKNIRTAVLYFINEMDAFLANLERRLKVPKSDISKGKGEAEQYEKISYLLQNDNIDHLSLYHELQEKLKSAYENTFQEGGGGASPTKSA